MQNIPPDSTGFRRRLTILAVIAAAGIAVLAARVIWLQALH